jgi:cytochrome c oxidase accessory protein FixG
MTRHNPQDNWTIFLVMGFITAVILFDFGWFREQFCIIMCPYGRFQSVLLDDDSLTVSYDPVRGEPRRGAVSKEQEEGDCIDCYKCVAVCPTGIDIRDGLQLECIGCTACIDACDEVMEKIEKPKGLIRYATGNSLKGVKSKFLKPRVAIYSVLLIAVISALIFSISKREDIVVTVLRGKDSPYQVIKNGENGEEVVNHFKLHLKNQTFDNINLRMEMPSIWQKENVEIVSQTQTIKLDGGMNSTLHIFIKFPASITNAEGSKNIELDFIDTKNNEVRTREDVKLVGPKSI